VTKLRHYDHLGTARFVTFSTYRREPLLTDDSIRRIIVEHLELVRRSFDVKLLSYVLMPEHVHLVIYPPDGLELGRVIGEMKSRSARAIFSQMGNPPQAAIKYPPQAVMKYPPQAVGHRSSKPEIDRSFWLKRCYDHNCRTPDTVREKIHYCHINPVKRGLVADPGDWYWSSYNWYTGGSDIPLEMDEFEF